MTSFEPPHLCHMLQRLSAALQHLLPRPHLARGVRWRRHLWLQRVVALALLFQKHLLALQLLRLHPRCLRVQQLHLVHSSSVMHEKPHLIVII